MGGVARGKRSFDNRARLSRSRCLSRFPDSWPRVAFLRWLLSIMTGAQRGFAPPGRKSAQRLSSLIASALPVEVAKKCLLTA